MVSPLVTSYWPVCSDPIPSAPISQHLGSRPSLPAHVHCQGFFWGVTSLSGSASSPASPSLPTDSLFFFVCLLLLCFPFVHGFPWSGFCCSWSYCDQVHHNSPHPRSFGSSKCLQSSCHLLRTCSQSSFLLLGVHHLYSECP